MENCEREWKQARFCGRVLVVEDSRTNQVLMKTVLGKFGLEVAVADDGDEAVEKASSGLFDVIFMDIQMPRMDGYEATRALRERGIRTPIIALTAYAEEADRAECLAAGCDDYLSKPLDRSDLLEKLGRYLCATGSPGDTCAPPGARAELEQEKSLPSRPDSERQPREPQGKPILDWESLVEHGFDEALALSVMPVCIADNRERLQKLTLALRAHRTEDVRTYAHAMIGSFASAGVVALAQISRRLDEQAKQQDLSSAEQSLAGLEKGLEELASLIATPGWAGRQTKR